jgi:tripartite-type tricarboxylate transporter receptor subunit TctC
MYKIPLLVLAFLCNFSVFANEYPNKPITIVIGYPPGGGTDLVGRYIFGKLSHKTHWTIVIENKPGATGVIASRDISKSKPDGYRLLLGHIAPNAINPGDFTDPKIPIDWNLIPIVRIATAPLVLLSYSGSKILDIGYFDILRSTESIIYGSDGVGSLSHLQMHSLLNDANSVHIPYKGGAPAMMGLLSKDVPVLFSPLPVALPYIKSNKVVVLLHTGINNIDLLPEIKSIHRVYRNQLSGELWWGLFAPVGIPTDILALWERNIQEIMQEPETQNWLSEQGYTYGYMSTEEFSKFVSIEIKKWKEVSDSIRK